MSAPVEHAALDRFLADVEKRAYAMAMITVKNPDDALDIVQDAMLTLAKKYGHKPSDEWRPLFFRILKNRITDHHRSGSVKRRVFSWFTADDEADPIESASSPLIDSPEYATEQDEYRQGIAEALAQLPERQREAFMFRAWEGMDVKETASAMGVSSGSVKTHYSRAVHSLRKLLEAVQ